jgi:hypothetical protein
MHPPITPMTLGNMRENGVRSLLVTCSNVTCRHEKIVDVDAYGDDLFVPSFGPRMRCERCGQRGADGRPNWNEHAPPVWSALIPA